MRTAKFDWAAIDADPKFQGLHRRKARFLTRLMLASVVYYFLLPVGAAYFPELYAIEVYGAVNLGLVFALSEFVFAWGIAIVYTRKANADFDKAAAEIAREAVAKYVSRRP